MLFAASVCVGSALGSAAIRASRKKKVGMIVFLTSLLRVVARFFNREEYMLRQLYDAYGKGG